MIHGELASLHLGDLLQWLQLGGLSGRLTLLGEGKERRLDFLDGRVVFVSSLVPSERLGSWLAAQGVLPVDILRRALAISLFRRNLYTEVLVEAGAIDSASLVAAIKRLATTITTRILLSPAQSFTFDPSFPVQDLLALDLELDPNQLLLEAARQTDEGNGDACERPEAEFPFKGEAFEDFFWELVQQGISADDDVDGSELRRLRSGVGDVVGVLSQWAATSPGLVPVPKLQAARVAETLQEATGLPFFGNPHTVWNQMAIVCGVRAPGEAVPFSLAELSSDVCVRTVCEEMANSEAWRRPDVDRLDGLTSTTAQRWARLASSAAAHLGVVREETTLAAHLLVVPSDLVLWALTMVPVRHAGIRRALLELLPRRLGTILAIRAGFPANIVSLFHPTDPSPLAACLHLARPALSMPEVWPDPLPGGQEVLLQVAPAEALARAARAARESADASNTDEMG